MGSREAAEAHNKAGTAAYKAGNYGAAIEYYTEAATEKPHAKYLTNRANAHLRLNNAQAALEDAEQALCLDGNWIKGFYYKGVSLMQLGRIFEARDAFWAGLNVDPSHSDIKAAVFKCNTAIARAAECGALEQLRNPANLPAHAEDAEIRYQYSMKRVMALVKQQSFTAAASFKLRELTLEQLMPYTNVPGAESYLRARLLREDGFKALQALNIASAIPKLAAGYCLDPKAMGYPTHLELQQNLLPLLEAYMRKHPGKAAGLLLVAFWSSPSKSGRWLVDQLQQLVDEAPEQWRHGILREVASVSIRDDVADYEGAYNTAIQGLQLRPADPDLLFYKAWAYKLLSFKRLGEDPCPGVGASGFYSWVQKRVDDTMAVNKLFQDFIDVAPEHHSKVPNAYYYMAERVLCTRIVSRVPMRLNAPDDLAVAEQTAKLYDAGCAAEKNLPPFYLPIVCASRESVPMLLEHHMPGFLNSRCSKLGKVSASYGSSTPAGSDMYSHTGGVQPASSNQPARRGSLGPEGISSKMSTSNAAVQLQVHGKSDGAVAAAHSSAHAVQL